MPIHLKISRTKIKSNLLWILLICAPLFSPLYIQSQTEPFRKYATQAYNNSLLAKDTQFAARLRAMEDSIHPGADPIERKTIPVVFHILQSPGMPYITDSLLLHQLEQLNADYNQLSFASIQQFPCMLQYVNRAYIPKLDFCLADSIGHDDIPYQVTRINTSIQTYSDYTAISNTLLAGSNPILPDHCLNIWICNLPDTIVGFAQYPGGPLASDGIVMSYKYLIAPILNGKRDPIYNLGRPLTHLVGSYLGVYELWNEAHYCMDDEVLDTPIHNASNHGFDMQCNHVTTCDFHILEMFINFMDNATDSLTVMFTLGQVYRMHAVLNQPSYRKGLWSLPLLCTDSIASVTYDAPKQDTGSNPLDTMVIKIQVSFKPNPVSTDLFIDVTLNEISPVEVSMFDVTGKFILSDRWDENTKQYSKKIDVSTFPPGIYIVRLNTNEGTYTGSIAVIDY